MNFHSILLLLKNRISVAVVVLVVLVAGVSACQTEDPYARMYPRFDVEKQKAQDEKDIRTYFRKNNIDTTAANTNLIKTASGLYYLRVKEGTGDLLKTGDKVDVHYIGKFLWGQEFDNSYNRGSAFPVTIGTTSVIKGWTEGLTLMKEGEEGFLFVPSHLAYGPYDQRGFANMVLIFDMTVLDKH
ncbi:FKBP-type peptidyl-prolyl cis-trans isomerase [Botryobacter ruber]|uniref:FKBP-type peptidyl-prolyl cis-trans isomerase n=1 Tax=Botryobacter ruber TaxID=2171629 RepID=UPI000E0C4D07|nr:FKBP-type peptidyl-prolyl cis-trans isomerase [Botryobacter ruber]